MKKSMNGIATVDGEEISVNKVDAALASAGVSLKNANNEFRDLDDVLLELASKWKSLDIMTQRYIATTAAGSRQQSRFIAMLQDYDRTMELVDAAYNSAGSSSKQFEKTQESLESMLARLRNAWNDFLMGIADDKIVKFFVNALTELISAFNNLTKPMDGVIGSAIRLGAVFGGLRLANTGIQKAITQFVTLKRSVEGAEGAYKSLSAVQKLTQKINNFSLGKSFAVDSQVDTKGFKNKIETMKSDWAGLKQAITKKVPVSGITLGFQEIDGAMAVTSSIANKTGEQISVGLSEVGTSALLTSDACQKIGKNLTKTGLLGSEALSTLQTKYNDLIAQAEKYLALANKSGVSDSAKQRYLNAAQIRKNQAGQVAGDIEGLKELGGKGAEQYSNGLIETLKKRVSQVGTTITGGLSKLASAFGASGAVAGGFIAAGIVAAVAAVAGTVYAMWYNSAEQTMKRIAATDAATLKRTQEEVEALKSKVKDLTDAWDNLTEHSNNMEGLIQGTSKWKEELNASNEEIQSLLSKYPELYKFLSIDKQTGQWLLNKDGYSQYQNQQQKELTDTQNRQIFQDMVATGSQSRYEALIKQKSKNGIADFGRTVNSLKFSYAQSLRQIYDEIHGSGGASLSLEELAQDSKVRSKIENMSEKEAKKDASWFSDIANPKAALEYADDIIKSKENTKYKSDAYIRSYMASTGASDLIQDAVAGVYSRNEQLSLDEQIRADRDKRHYDGGTGGTGIAMRGKGSMDQPTVQSIMEQQGYELVDELRNIYFNKNTGKYVNVDKVGNADSTKTSTRKVNGEKVEVLQWSDEYVRDMGRSEGIRAKSSQDMDLLAKAFAENENLAKVIAGDLSAKIDEADSWENITGADNQQLLDVEAAIEDFKAFRSKTMDDLNAKYGEVFTTSTKPTDYPDIYSDQMYEAAQATIQFEKSVSGLGSGTAQILTSTFLALTDLEDQTIGLNTAIDNIIDSNLAGSLAKSLEEAGLSAQGLQNFVNKLDMSSAINGARQLKQALDEGGQSAAYANTVIMADINGFYSAGNQFKEMISNEGWADTQKSLTEIYNLTGNITADNIRDLTEKSSDLAAILETNSLKASGFAEMMKAVERGTIDLTDVTTDLIKVYEGLYYSADLAGEAIARLEKAKIGDSDTKIGNIYSESWGAIQDLIDRGAYGDSQIDDYMKQLVGSATWSNALSNAGGDKTEAVKAIDQIYGLSANSGNLYGSWTTLLGNLGGSVADGTITLGPDGTLNYDLSKVESTQQLVQKMVDEMHISEDYANTLLADMKTYSKTFGSDLDDLDKRGTLKDFLNSRTTEDGTLNISNSELEAFAKSLNQSVDEFKGSLQKSGIRNFEDRQYSESGYYYTTTDENTGETTASFTDETAKGQIQEKINGISSEIKVKITGENGDVVNQDYLNELLKIDEIREIVLDPNLTEESKKKLLGELEGLSGELGNDIVDSLFTEKSKTNAAGYAEYLGVQMYNSIGGYLTEAMNVLADNEIRIKVGFSLGKLTVPTNAFTDLLGISGTTIDFKVSGGYLTIGGEGTSGPGSSGGGFVPKTSSYNPPTKDINPEGGGKNGTGKGYLNKNDSNNDPTKEKSGGGSDDKEKNRTNYNEENANKQLDALERLRETNDREAELIDKLPEEIQFPLKMANLGEDMFYEYQEIQINKNKLAALESQKQMEQANAEFLNKYYYFDELLGAYMYNVDAMNSLSDEDRNKVEEEINSLQELQDKINDVNQELDGGKIQKIFRGLAKASTDTSKALKGTSKASDMLEEEFGNLADKFGLGDQLDKFGKSLDSAIDESKFLKKEFKGLGIVSEDMLSKIDNLPFGDATKSLIKNTLGTNENGTIGSFLGDSFGAAGEMFDGLADVLNFDMMSMGLDAFNNMKDMASKIIQQVVSVIQTVVSWWTNREDWLYNLLSAIEQEVHNFNRQEQVEERFRLYSDEGLNDLVSAWEAMRASLEKQIDLNEQLIKSRQAELQFLNLTNLPFSPAFYYDYKEERVIENPWVYDIYVLLLDLGSMIPEIGGVFSSIKQLMEDNKKRMEDAVDEIESAREQILELEKQQLELRTKYMEDEEELEQLVMDAIIEKQQEEIDELTAMNDAISEGNQKLIDALNDNLDKIREMRDNQDREEELAQKERRLAYLRQDTSGANRAQILDLQKELEDERRDYTDNLIDQKISELEKQNEDAAEQRQKQIDLLQEQLDYTEKYGLQWKEAQTLIKNGFDNEGRLRVGSELFDLLMSKEDFTSLGNGSTRQNRQIMDWNVTGIAAAAYREINHIWDKGFGNFEMSNDVHDQSRLHLWEDRDIEYRQLPSWLSFLQPAYNSIQDYAWRTKQNLGSFIETGYLSGSNSSSILGKTVVPLIQRIAANIEAMVNDYKSITDAETGGAQKIAGVITSSTDNLGLSLGERILSGFSKSISTLGDDIISGVKVATQSNSSKTVTSTQNYGDIVFNNHFDSEENGDSIIERMVDFFRRGNQGLSVV